MSPSGSELDNVPTVASAAFSAIELADNETEVGASSASVTVIENAWFVVRLPPSAVVTVTEYDACDS